MPARTSRLQLPFAAAALFTVTLLLGPPGKSASPEDFHANIVNGRLTSGFPAAGALLLGDEATAVTWCSGVLIGCDTFLTAAHCVCDTHGADCQGAPDVGLKRSGAITTAPCTDGISDDTAVCWNFTGTGSNSCNGDSGGPLFVDSGFGTVVAGIASGGRNADCLAGDFTFDASVAA